MRTFILWLLCALNVSAEIIPIDRRTDWVNYAGVKGGIPAVTVIFQTISAGASITTVNSAIASCPSNQVVFLSAGSYSFAGSIQIKKRGVVLRGAGPASTHVAFTSTSALGGVQVYPNSTDIHDPSGAPDGFHNWTSGYAQGTASITVDSTTGMSVGMLLGLDQINDGIDVTQLGDEGCPYCSRNISGAGQGGGRAQVQYVRVTSISGTTIGIDPPIMMPNISGAQTPQCFWYWPTDFPQMNGIEDIDFNFAGDTQQWGVDFHAGWNCWIKNCELHHANQAAVHTWYGGRIEIRHSYVHDSQNAASQSYGVLPYYCSGFWEEDNIFNKVVGMFVPGSQAQGCVASFNYSTNTFYDVNPQDGVTDNSMIATMAPHDAHNCMNLFEGNHADGYTADFIHGSGSHGTVFRNRIVGWEPIPGVPAGKGNQTYCIDVCRTNHYYNIVANLLGQAGYHNNYVTVNGSANPQTSIYRWGNRDNGGVSPYDPLCISTAIVHANWDVVNNGQVFDSGIADHAPVSSYVYPSGRPSWWGTDLPWPPFDPTRTTAKDLDPTNINAGYRFIFGVDPPTGGGGGPPPTAPNPTFKLKGKGTRSGAMR